jgi:gamma-glutamyltranspeptidase/glutathione hydrolase
MTAIRVVVVALALVLVFPTAATARRTDAGPNTAYSLSALALLGSAGTELAVTVSSDTASIPDQFQKVQVKVWPFDGGRVETRNYFDVPAPGGVATLMLTGPGRMQRIHVQVLVKEQSQNVLEAETVVQYRALGAVSTDHPLATKAGEAILRAGGNAFDAAAGILFVLNVTQPHLAGIGGSSNIVLYSALDRRVYSIDARERAPATVAPTTFEGQTPGAISVNGYSVGVPGTLRAVEYMLGRWGSMTVAETLQPAIGHAENGFSVGWFLAKDAADNATFKPDFQPETKALFRPSGVPVQEGDLLVQPDLAKTFRLLATEGSSVFYRGEIAAAIVEAQKRHTYPAGEGGMTLADLASYDIAVRKASHLNYKGYDVYTASPSSSALVLLETLGLLEDLRFPIGDVAAGYGFGTRYTIHAMVEALRLALADRDAWIGDPTYFVVPEAGLLSEAYLAERALLMNPFPVRMSPGVSPPPGNPRAFASAMDEEDPEPASTGDHTTHFSVIDRYGNVVSFTTTMADSFGSGIMVPGYGFLLNDSLRLFNLTPNGGPNDAGPNKRPMGSMTPVVMMQDGEPFAATGTWGSNFIPSLMLNVVLDLVDHDLPLQQAVDASRIWIALPTGGYAWNHARRGAPEISLVEIDALRALGPPNRPVRVPAAREEIFGSLASVGVEPGTFALQSASDDLRQRDAAGVVVNR